jgi:hypothetical protein
MLDETTRIIDKVKDPDYFRQVQANMYAWSKYSIKEVYVYFGTTGNGTAPHYHLIERDRCKRFGHGHKQYHTDPNIPFESAHVEGPYSYDDMVAKRKSMRGR